MPTMPKARRAPWHPERKAWEHPNRWEGYRTWRWQKASLQFKILNPVCCVPGCGNATYVTDHRVPISEGCDPWDQSNWQPLCYACNKEKTSSEGGRASAGRGEPGKR